MTKSQIMGLIGLVGLTGLIVAPLAVAQGTIFGPDICDPQRDPASCNICAFMRLVKKIIDWLTGIAFLLATVFIIFGGFVIMTAGGSPEKVKKGREIITAAVIGILLTLAAWLIVGTVLQIITGAPPGQAPAGFPWPWNQIRC